MRKSRKEKDKNKRQRQKQRTKSKKQKRRTKYSETRGRKRRSGKVKVVGGKWTERLLKKMAKRKRPEDEIVWVCKKHRVLNGGRCVLCEDQLSLWEVSKK